jgi:hypothetical protein
LFWAVWVLLLIGLIAVMAMCNNHWVFMPIAAAVLTACIALPWHMVEEEKAHLIVSWCFHPSAQLIKSGINRIETLFVEKGENQK